MFPFVILTPILSPGSTIECVPTQINADGSITVIGDPLFAVSSPAGMNNTVSGKVAKISMGPGTSNEGMLLAAIYGTLGSGLHAAIAPIVRK